MTHSVSRTLTSQGSLVAPSLTIMETAGYTTCHCSWRSPWSPLPSPNPEVLAGSGSEGVPLIAYLLMTVSHTSEGPVNLTDSNKLEKGTHPIWKERVGGLGREGYLSWM